MEIPEIKFGTDGWRGILADDFTYNNAALVASAVNAYLAEDGQPDKPVLIGYDRRFMAEDLAAHLANHLHGIGRDVIVHEAPCPTPVSAFGVQHLKAAGAIMLTASHNPYYYQGFKFIPHFAGPAMPAATNRITELIKELAPDFTPPPLSQKWDGDTVNLRDAYFTHLDTIVNVHSLSSQSWELMYNPMHGVGAGYVDGYLERAGVKVTTINTERDVYFGTTLPDPSEANLSALVPKLVEEGCQLMLVNDGDADRFGLIDSDGKYLGANHALPLIADYLINYKQGKGSLVRTVSTSHLLDDLAAEQGLEVIETAVGFKYVGDELRKGALIGGEESGGISVKGHIPEKDGILTCLLLLELAATSGEGLQVLLEQLQERIGRRAFIRVDQELEDSEKLALIGALKSYDKDKFAGKKIAKRNEIDGVKFLLEDNSWVLVRPSGTEPLVRIYIEVTQPEALGKFKAQVLDQVKALVRS